MRTGSISFRVKAISKELEHLIERGLVVLTRQGGMRNVCSLYALGWKPISDKVTEKVRGEGYEGPVEPINQWKSWGLECVS